MLKQNNKNNNKQKQNNKTNQKQAELFKANRVPVASS
jgi:hypothetical protein